MKKYILFFINLIITGTFVSCNYLEVDKYFDDTLKYDSIFSNKKNLLNYMWGTAANFPDEGGFLRYSSFSPGPIATDEAFTTYGTEEFRGMAYVLGEISENDLKGLNNWGNMYKIIRKANTILARMDEAEDMTTVEKFEVLAYTHFMRGYAYYQLLMSYGPVILMGDNILENNEEASYYNTHRATYDESVDYICNEFEIAARYLPLNVLVNQFGRPTRGAAYAMIARLRLQQASPLFNGGDIAKRYYSSWLRSVDQVPYISQTYDEKKWAVAAAAARRVMDMGIYELHIVERDPFTPVLPSGVSSADFPEGAGNVDGFRSYAEMFNGETVAQKNKEYIWARRSGEIHNILPHCFPYPLGGWNGGLGVTQKVIDTYLMADGNDRNHASPEYPYQEDQMFSMNNNGFSGYVFTNQKQISGMYVNREPRFYASIGFSGRFWACNSTTTNDKEFTATYDSNGNSGRYAANENVAYNYPATGYVLTKFIHPDDAMKGDGSSILDKSFPIIRYAEILLSYAEALNNLKESHTVTLGDETNPYTVTVSRDADEIKKAFDQIRYRVTLPGLTPGEVADPAKVQELIENERMVEFLFENRRFYDVRRWGIYEQTESEPVMGMNIEVPEPLYYTRTIINHMRVRNRIVDKKMIFQPLPKSEIRKVPDLDQNPGWGS